MATTYTHTTVASIGAAIAHRAVYALSNMVASIQAWNDNRRTIKVLRTLSSTQLDDIGLTRADVENFGR